MTKTNLENANRGLQDHTLRKCLRKRICNGLYHSGIVPSGQMTFQRKARRFNSRGLHIFPVQVKPPVMVAGHVERSVSPRIIQTAIPTFK